MDHRAVLETGDEPQPRPEQGASFRPPSIRSRSGCAGCAWALLLVGSLLVAGGLAQGWIWLHADYYNSVGPPIAAVGLVLLMAAGFFGLLLGLFWLAFFRPAIRTIGLVGAALLCLFVVAAVLNWAPWVGPRTYVRPEIVGVMVSSEQGPDGLDTVRLDGGQTLDLRGFDGHTGDVGKAGRYTPLIGRGGTEVGELVLAGEKPTPWYLGAQPETARFWGQETQCYWLTGARSTVQRDTFQVDFYQYDFGIELDKAPTLDLGWSPAVGDKLPEDVCLNSKGQVAGLGPGPY